MPCVSWRICKQHCFMAVMGLLWFGHVGWINQESQNGFMSWFSVLCFLYVKTQFSKIHRELIPCDSLIWSNPYKVKVKTNRSSTLTPDGVFPAVWLHHRVSLQVCREHAVRGARHLRLPRGLALGAAARPGACHVGEERRHHLLHHTDLHLHAGAGTEATLQRRRRHPAGQQLGPAQQQQPGGWLQRLRLQQHFQRRSHVFFLHRRSRGLLTHTWGGALIHALRANIPWGIWRL